MPTVSLTVRGGSVSQRALAKLLHNEALIGHFVSGRKMRALTFVSSPPSRLGGGVPRLIEDDTGL